MLDFANLTANSFVVLNQTLNDTYTNTTFIVQLASNITWDRIQVLSIWDRLIASDFGHHLRSVRVAVIC